MDEQMVKLRVLCRGVGGFGGKQGRDRATLVALLFPMLALKLWEAVTSRYSLS